MIDIVDIEALRSSARRCNRYLIEAIKSSGRNVISVSGIFSASLRLMREATDFAQPVTVRIEELLEEQ